MKEVTLALLRRFGVCDDDETFKRMSITVRARGARPHGGGVVDFTCMNVRQLRPVDFTDSGMVKRIRGVAYSTKVSPQVPNRMVHTARGVFNQLIPDVFIHTDVYSGKTSGNSPGFAMFLNAESTTGCVVSTEACANGSEMPEDVAMKAANQLLEEVWEGGCIDSTHQPLMFTLMAVTPEDVSRIRTGPLTPAAIDTLRLIQDFLGVTFKLRTDPENNSVLAACQGCGFRNTARQVS